MRENLRSFVLAVTCLLVFSMHSYAQSEQPTPANPSHAVDNKAVVFMSDETSTVRIANPNELIGINGRVVRVDEFMAFLSANIALVQHPHIPEKQNSSSSPQVAPQSKTHLDSPLPAAAPVAGPVPPPAEAPRKH
jgi:hypothetical protein